MSEDKTNGITIPNMGGIDFGKFTDFYDLDLNLEEDTARAVKIILENIFAKTFTKKFKTQKYKDGGVKYEFDTYHCYLAIYLKDLTLSYTVRTKTMNYSKDITRSAYFNPEYMAYSPNSLLVNILRDFSKLTHYCSNLAPAPEWTDDCIPRGTETVDGVPFYGVHENIILKPMQYYKSDEAQKALDGKTNKK